MHGIVDRPTCVSYTRQSEVLWHGTQGCVTVLYDM